MVVSTIVVNTLGHIVENLLTVSLGGFNGGGISQVTEEQSLVMFPGILELTAKLLGFSYGTHNQ